MASDAASDAAASVGFDSIEDFFSFVEEQESSPVPTPDKDLTCVSDASDTHCIIHSLDGYHAALKKTIHSPESQCKPGLFTLSQPLHNLNTDSRPHHPASLGQGIVTFQAGAEHTEFGYGSQGVKFPKDSHPLYRETQGEQAHEIGMKTGSVAMMWDAGSLNMDFLNNVRNDPQGVGCCGVHSLANCACVILGAYGLESFKSTDGGLVSGSCKGNVWNTLFEYNRSAVEDVVGQKFKPYLVNETKAKVMNENVTAFELMKDTFPQVFNEGQKCDSGNHACPCQNLTHPPWWNGESESGKALLEAAKHWFNGVEQGPNQDSWTNAFVDNEESHSVFAMHRKVVGTLFPGGLGNGTSKDRANNAANLMNTVKISMFEELAKPDADGRVALCQSPLAVRAYTWVMLDANKANHGNGDLSDGGGDWVVPMNPNLEKLLSQKSPILGHQMAVLPMMDNEP